MQCLRSILSVAVLVGGSVIGCSSSNDDAETASAETGTETGEQGESETGEQGETGTADAAAAYCSCMLISCHETYHDEWGEEELPAQEACIAEAEGLPVSGADVDAGNFLECRQHFCAMATDAACPTGDGCDACEAAIGRAVCM